MNTTVAVNTGTIVPVAALVPLECLVEPQNSHTSGSGAAANGPPMQTVTMTIFSDYAATRKLEVSITLEELANKIRERSAEVKHKLPWLKLARFGNKRSNKNSLRHDANVLSVTGVEADYDGGKIPFRDACEKLEQAGIRCIVYTSPSYTDAKPRWRVICPFTAPMQPEYRAMLLGRLNGLFGGIFSTESWTLSQAYYYGSVDSNPAHNVAVIDGTTIDEHDELDEIWMGKAGNAPAGVQGASSDAIADGELIRQIVTGECLHTTMCSLAARYIGRGVSTSATTEILQGFMLSHPEAARDERWQTRYASIDELVASANAKYGGHQRELTKLAGSMFRERRPSQEVRDAVLRKAAELDVDADRAERILNWVAQREVERREGKK